MRTSHQHQVPHADTPTLQPTVPREAGLARTDSIASSTDTAASIRPTDSPSCPGGGSKWEVSEKRVMREERKERSVVIKGTVGSSINVFRGFLRLLPSLRTL